MGRIYDIKLDCGCLISSDGGGGLIYCHDEENCKYKEWTKTEDYKKFKKEVRERQR